jgi:hypothetical protein
MGGTQWATHDLEGKINKPIASLFIFLKPYLKRLPDHAETVVCG